MARSRSLVTFAFVHEALKSGDIISGLMPLLAPVIKHRHGKVFDPKVFAEDINNYYGIHVHHYVAEDWTERLFRAGLLTPLTDKRQTRGEYASYICNDPDIPDQSAIEKQFNTLLDEFCAYARPLFDELKIPIPAKNSIEEMFIDRIKDMEFDDIVGKPDNEYSDRKILSTSKPTANNLDNTIGETMDVACASFILDLKDRFPDRFATLVEIASGALAAEVVLSFRVPPKRGQNFNGKTVILDSPIVLDFFDIGSIDECDFAKTLVQNLHDEGASVAIYDHNISEIVDILTAIKFNQEKGVNSSGSVAARLRVDKNAPIRINSLLNNPFKKIAQAGISIINVDSIDRPYLKYFDKESELDLLASIRPFSTSRIESREVDAASIASMIRYAFGKKPLGNVMAYEKLFVTKNRGLAAAAARYMKKVHAIAEDADPPFLTDRYLAGIIWLAKGGNGTDVPRRKLIANCTSAVRPRRDVISKMQYVLKNTSPAQAREFEAVIEDERCGYYLMRHSLGSAQLVTNENALTLLEQIKAATAEKVAKEAEEKAEKRIIAERKIIEDERLQFQATRDEYENRLNKSQQEKIDASERLAMISEQKARIEESRQALEIEKKKLQSEIQRSEEERFFRCQTQAEALFADSKWVDWGCRLIFFLFIYVASSLAQKLAFANPFWPFISLFISAGFGLVQFSIFPDMFLSGAIRRMRAKKFEKQFHRHGLEKDFSYEIDWTKNEVHLKAHTSSPP